MAAAFANLVLLSVGHPGSAGLAVLQLLAMLAVLGIAAPRLERAPTTLAQLDVLATTGFTMGLTLADPALFPLTAIYLAIVPLAMALLLAWSPRTHVMAVIGFIAAAVCCLAVAPASIDGESRVEALGGCASACVLSVFANFEETFWLHEVVRRMQQLREKQTRLRAIASAREREARMDPLTDLASRRAFDEDLAALSEGERRDTVTSIAIVDLDRFKGYNDRYGHPAGDRLLSQLGECFRSGLRAGDRGYRYGGDEFVFLMPGTRAAEAGMVIRRVAEAFQMRAIDHASNEPWGRATFSAGVADGSEALVFEDVLRLADDRLYRAKELGGNRTVTPAMWPPEPASERGGESSRAEAVHEIRRLLTAVAMNLRPASLFDMEHADLTANQLLTLLLLRSSRDGRMKANDIADQMGISTPAATALVDRLVKMGMVQRARGDDRRVVWISMTGQGQTLMQRLALGIRPRIDAAILEMDDEAVVAVVEGMRQAVGFAVLMDRVDAEQSES